MRKAFDYKDLFLARTKERIKKLRIMGRFHQIPFLLCFAVKNNDETTEYVNYVNTCVSRIGYLSRDIIPDCINVMFNGFHAIKLNTMDDDMENHQGEGEIVPGSSEEKPIKEIYNCSEVFEKQFRPHVEAVEDFCKSCQIPYLMVFAVKDDGIDTSYISFFGMDNAEELSKNAITIGAKLIQEHLISSLDEIMDDTTSFEVGKGIVENYMGDPEDTSDSSQSVNEENEKRVSGSTNTGLPDCWRVYRKGEE